MTIEDAVARSQVYLAHLWMIRTFLKHADETADNPELLEVPRTLYDSIRAVEPALQNNDLPRYMRKLAGKLGKLGKIATFFQQEYKNYSAHTNFEMAALSLSGAVAGLQELVKQYNQTSSTAPVGEMEEVDDGE
ncbi:MAG: hypothetical protein R3B84_17475 [Zavarzinella sp.]